MTRIPPETAAVLARMRARDQAAGNRPLLCEQAALMGDTLHWSVTHHWPAVCGEMRDLGLVTVVARPPGGTFAVTEITALGRAVRYALVNGEDVP